MEDRSWYYASLVLDLDIDIEAVLPAMTGPADPAGDHLFWIPTEVLSLCAKAGRPGAIAEVRWYLRSGRDLDVALAALLPVAGHADAAGFARDLLGAGDLDAIAEALRWESVDFSEAAWMRERRAQPEVEAVIDVVNETRFVPARSTAPLEESTTSLLRSASGQSQAAHFFARSLRSHTDPDDKALLAAAATSSDVGAAAAALIALGEQNDDRLVALGVPLLDGITCDPTVVQQAVLRGLRAMSSDRALAWARTAADDPVCGYAATEVLTRLAISDDLPRLRTLLDAATADGDIYGQCDLVDALDRLADETSTPMFASLYDKTTYSYLRRRCASALATLDPTFASTRAVESLWDCEPETRTVGITHVSGTTNVVRRLRSIIADPLEKAEVASQAERRLGELP